MEKILIRGATVIPMTGPENIIDNGEIAIEAGKIKAVGPAGTAGAGWSADKVIDAKGMVALPGFINCHTHAAMTLLRSYADDLPLMQWLSERIWPLENRLTGEDVYWGTMLCVLEMIKSGTTTFADMYFFMDDVAKAVRQSGMRASLSRGMIGVAPTAELALEESEAFIREWHGGADGRITTMLGPHAPHTCPPAYLEKVMALASRFNVGIHIHLAETLPEVSEIRKEYGKSPIAYVNDIGLLDFPVLGAHCVHVSPEDIKIMKDKDVRVAHNPESNMKLASGIAPVPQMLADGVTVALGTDGAASNNNLDLMEEMRSAALLHKVNTMDPAAIPAYTALEMATSNGARALDLEKEIGIIRPGYKADVILIDFEQPHLYPKHDLIAHTVYAAQSADVITVIIDGRVVMENRKVLTLDETEVLRKVQEHALKLTGNK
ncbi:MAG: amidohydrolase [Bacillota bacterium]